MTQSANNQGKVLWAVIIVLLLLGIIGLGWKFLQEREKRADPVTALDQTVSQTSGEVRQTVQPEPVVEFDKMEKDEAMAQRKSALGIDKSIDMVVTSGDTLKIGNTTIPFDDVLAKIRIKGGKIGEGDLKLDGASTEIAPTMAEIDQLATDIQVEIEAVDQQLADEQLTPESRSGLMEKRKRFRQLDDAYKEYMQLNETLMLTQERLQTATDNTEKRALQQEIDTLQKQIAAKKEIFITQIKAGNAMGAYGIHVVKPNDNIWNIHFQFLKSYFTKRGITVSPVADEPLRTGKSSGVGKLLKFSENMVHIYNLKTRQIDQDLHTIEPLSKIVVFNLGQVFALLNTINYEQINHIEFDGETLWLPEGS